MLRAFTFCVAAALFVSDTCLTGECHRSNWILIQIASLTVSEAMCWWVHEVKFVYVKLLLAAAGHSANLSFKPCIRLKELACGLNEWLHRCSCFDGETESQIARLFPVIPSRLWKTSMFSRVWMARHLVLTVNEVTILTFHSVLVRESFMFKLHMVSVLLVDEVLSEL